MVHCGAVFPTRVCVSAAVETASTLEAVMVVVGGIMMQKVFDSRSLEEAVRTEVQVLKLVRSAFVTLNVSFKVFPTYCCVAACLSHAFERRD